MTYFESMYQRSLRFFEEKFQEQFSALAESLKYEEGLKAWEIDFKKWLEQTLCDVKKNASIDINLPESLQKTLKDLTDNAIKQMDENSAQLCEENFKNFLESMSETGNLYECISNECWELRKEHLKDQYLSTLFSVPPVKQQKMPSIKKKYIPNQSIWESEEQRRAEWQIATNKLQQEKNGTKFRRKDSHLMHSFIILNNRILAMAPKGCYLGTGKYGRVKLAEDEDGQYWAIKIQDASSHQDEANITADLYDTLGPTSRKGKYYYAMRYLGIPFQKFMENIQLDDMQLNVHERLDISLKLCQAVYALHRGESSKQQKHYIHTDLHLNNFLIAKEGNEYQVNLIDFGLSHELDSKISDPIAHIKWDVSSVIRAIKLVFPKEYRQKNCPEIDKALVNCLIYKETDYNLLDLIRDLEAMKRQVDSSIPPHL